MPKPNLKKKRSLLALLLVALLLISGIPTPIFATENEISESTAEVTTIAETADTGTGTTEATPSFQEATDATEEVTPSESIPETIDTAPPEAERSLEDNHPLEPEIPSEENTETLPLADLDEENTGETEMAFATRSRAQDYSTGLPIDTRSTWETNIPGYSYKNIWLGGPWTDKNGNYHPAEDWSTATFFTSVSGTGAGEACFCIEHGELDWWSVAATRPLAEIVGADKARDMSLAAYFGYYSNKSTENRIFTQFYIWEVYPTNSAGFDNRCIIVPDDADVNARYQVFKSNLTERIANAKLTPSFASETIDVIGSQTTTVTDENGVLSYFMDANAWEAGVPYTQDGFTIMWDGSNSLSVQATATATTLTMTLANVLAAYQVPPSALVTPTDYVGQYTMTYGVGEPTLFTFSLQRKPGSGRFMLKKTDEHGQGLSGAEFSLTAPDGTVSHIQIESETYSSGDLAPGKYTLVETKAPHGYLLDATPRTITIEEESVNQVYFNQAIVNRVPVGVAIVGKADGSTAAPVADARFDILDVGGNIVDTITTGADGKGESKQLPLGNYQLVERSVPTPYLLDSEPIPFTLAYVDQNTAIVSEQISVENERAQGKIQIVKQDAIDQRPIAGVLFDILDSSDNVVATVKTDENGFAETELLPLGEYVAVETKEAEGYLKNPARTPITLAYKDMHTALITAKAIIENAPITGRIQVVKVEEDQETPIPGAVFKVFDRATGNIALGLDNKPLAELTTDEDGFAFTPTLRYGDYYLVEQDAPKQYLLNQNEYDVLLRQHDKTEVIYIANRFVELRLRITKIDSSTKEPLSDVEFQVLDESGNVVTFQYLNDQQEIVEQTHLITNQEGVAYTRGFLRAGEYEVVEVKTPDGYLPVAAQRFSISRDSNYVDLEFFGATTDLLIGNAPTKVLLSKKSVSGEDELPGAHLQVFEKSTGAIVDEWISGNEAHLIERLKIGETYVLRESLAPLGYALAGDVEFVIAETEDVQVVEMKDEPTGIVIEKLDAETKEALQGVSFRLSNSEGEAIPLREKDGVYIFDPTAEDNLATSNETGAVHIHGLPLGEYVLVEEAYDGYVTSEPVTFNVLPTNSVSNPKRVKVENQPVIVTLTKSDLVTGAPLPGASIVIEDENGELVQEAITDSDGHVILKRLAPGTYRFKEKAHPKGYVLNTETFTFSVSPDGDISGVTEFTNEPTELQIKKTVDATNEALEGILFRLHFSNGETVCFELEDGIYIADAKGKHTDLRSDRSGLVRLRYLPQGDYLLEEIKADGFVRIQEAITVSVDETSSITDPKTISVTNKEIEVVLTKTDITNEAPVPGATIEISDASGKVIQKAVTDENGTVTLRRLPAGNYTFREVLAPEGYILNPDVFRFTVDDQGKVNGTTSFTDEPTELRIYKSVKESDKPIGGVSFQLTFPDKTPVKFRLENGIYIASKDGDIEQLVTDKNGQIAVRYLPIGSFHIKETATAEGFILDETVYEIKLEGNHGVSNPLQIGLTNQKKKPTETPLPRTGEDASLALYIGGSALLALGLLTLILRKKLKRKQ